MNASDDEIEALLGQKKAEYGSFWIAAGNCI